MLIETKHGTTFGVETDAAGGRVVLACSAVDVTHGYRQVFIELGYIQVLDTIEALAEALRELIEV